MSVTSATSYWNLEAAEYQQLATLIANMVEGHLREASSRNPTSSETIKQDIDYDGQSLIATFA